MNPVPVMLRVRIADYALRIYPKGLTATNVRSNVAHTSPSDELREYLDQMARDGLLVRRMDPPSPHDRYRREPLRVFVASPALRGEGSGASRFPSGWGPTRAPGDASSVPGRGDAHSVPARGEGSRG